MRPTETLGKNIKFFREKKGIKQETLAKQIGITESRLSQIESGDCGELFLNRIEKIADLLEVSFLDLTGNSTLSVHINNSSNCGYFYSTNYNNSPELIKALADELLSRMQK
ncbi:MAG: helix-turn-helix domain-containing protein [Chitinophagaceae bacterium]|jgi:transcriptional regulator with XRE-family HTH domain|nr:helix-turn-helix domain-containing protein [Chitinophagaceae bacterium]